ncbi:ATP synthase F1 subunit delta [Konateibacter massiliensis]|uniref:ATP synthase F1 subunit delta n=1 Tax=Konateibacter massiliensis TaxID=2002841 RepID=UPI000C15B6F0|nr:ATP synthase F1 subunit delta [Konateibacter massiliensis]
MDKLVARTYGKALFELALEENKIDLLVEETLVLKEIISENAELYKLMAHPDITKNEKNEILDEILKGRVSEELTAFVHIVAAKSRFGELIYILEYFISEVNEYKGIGLAYVTAAMELTKAQQDSLIKKLIQITKYEEISLSVTIDESLIGGMIVRIGDRVIDNSIKMKMNGLSKQLLQIQL